MYHYRVNLKGIDSYIQVRASKMYVVGDAIVFEDSKGDETDIFNISVVTYAERLEKDNEVDE